jgi:hypothetical protein
MLHPIIVVKLGFHYATGNLKDVDNAIARSKCQQRRIGRKCKSISTNLNAGQQLLAFTCAHVHEPNAAI